LLYFRQLLIGLYFSCKIFLVLNFEVFLYLVVLIRFCRGVFKHLYFPCNNCPNLVTKINWFNFGDATVSFNSMD